MDVFPRHFVEHAIGAEMLRKAFHRGRLDRECLLQGVGTDAAQPLFRSLADGAPEPMRRRRRPHWHPHGWRHQGGRLLAEQRGHRPHGFQSPSVIFGAIGFDPDVANLAGVVEHFVARPGGQHHGPRAVLASLIHRRPLSACCGESLSITRTQDIRPHTRHGGIARAQRFLDDTQP